MSSQGSKTGYQKGYVGGKCGLFANYLDVTYIICSRTPSSATHLSISDYQFPLFMIRICNLPSFFLNFGVRIVHMLLISLAGERGRNLAVETSGAVTKLSDCGVGPHDVLYGHRMCYGILKEGR